MLNLNNFYLKYRKFLVYFKDRKIKGIIEDFQYNRRKKAMKELNKFFNKKFYPIIGKKENFILDNLEKQMNIIIIRQFPIDNYFLDGYCIEKNIAFEVDEKHHFKNGKRKNKDISRENIIKNKLNCGFIRIKTPD